MMTKYTPEKQIEKFWEKVDLSHPDDDFACWEWKKCRDKAGYGQINIHGVYLAHRFAYKVSFGDIPDGLFVCHHCDNPPCCNPNHLFLGTHQDNVEDMKSKNRSYHARRYHVLTEEQVIEMRRLYEGGGFNFTQLSAIFLISKVQVSNIIKRKCWKDI